jgi:hypothetical protein
LGIVRRNVAESRSDQSPNRRSVLLQVHQRLCLALSGSWSGTEPAVIRASSVRQGVSLARLSSGPGERAAQNVTLNLKFPLG